MPCAHSCRALGGPSCLGKLYIGFQKSRKKDYVKIAFVQITTFELSTKGL